MNRYYWIALCLATISAMTLSVIWILGSSNQEQREIISALFTVVGVFVTIIFGILGYIESKRKDANLEISIQSPKREFLSDLLNKENSILYYFGSYAKSGRPTP